VSWNDIPDWASHVTKALLKTLKAKDPHTFFHCCRVGRSARLLGKAAGLNEYEQHVLEYSGIFHDIGKIAIPDDVLFKPAKLSRDEYRLMKLHPVQSLDIITPLMDEAFFKDVAPAVELHHERLDGTGYPYGLSEKDIPIMTRIVTIVDSVDAMVSSRPYCKGLSMERVISELKRCSGTQFDESLVKIYLEAYKFWEKEKPKQEEGGLLVADHLLKAAS
jgi:HD-GYP domain-containing protein (c-di-GMP phosphodiesterase class II)